MATKNKLLHKGVNKCFQKRRNIPNGSKYTVILLWSKITLVWLCVKVILIYMRSRIYNRFLMRYISQMPTLHVIWPSSLEYKKMYLFSVFLSGFQGFSRYISCICALHYSNIITLSTLKTECDKIKIVYC